MSPDMLMMQLDHFLDAEVMELLYDAANPTPLRIPRPSATDDFPQ